MALKLLERLMARLDLPPEAEGAIRVTLSGQREVRIEHHRGLLAYSQRETEISGGSVRVRIRGDGLLLRAMTAEELLITGTVFGVDIE